MPVLNSTPYGVYESDILRAEGCMLYGPGERAWVDMEAGVWCAGLGHGDAAVAAAITAQLSCTAHLGYRVSQPVVTRAAGRLLEVLGLNGGQCVFLSSGSEAVEYAVTAAGHITGREKYLCLGGHFLSSYGASSRRPKDCWTELDLTADGWPEALAALPLEQYAAFVFEPGNGSGLVRLPDGQAVAAVVQAVRAAGGLVVVDEVTTGMGRTGRWFGVEHYDLKPDIVACGKGLGNGYPVSAVALAEGCAQRLLGSGFRYAQSHQNDPLGAAAALAVIEQMSALELPRQAERTGGWFLSQLDGLAARHRCIREVRGRGLMCAVTLTDQVDMASLHRGLFDAGFLVGMNEPARTLRFYPPLVIERQVLQALILALELLLP